MRRSSLCPPSREKQSGVPTEQQQRKESLVNIVNFWVYSLRHNIHNIPGNAILG